MVEAVLLLRILLRFISNTEMLIFKFNLIQHKILQDSWELAKEFDPATASHCRDCEEV